MNKNYLLIYALVGPIPHAFLYTFLNLKLDSR
jgi:hypothetical protein